MGRRGARWRAGGPPRDGASFAGARRPRRHHGAARDDPRPRAVAAPDLGGRDHSTAIVSLLTPLGACAAAVTYHDLRVAKEGVDTAALVKVFE